MASLAQAMLGNCIAVPRVLLDNYLRWGLTEQDLLLLIRCLPPLMNRGQVDVSWLSQEFALQEQDIAVLMQPLLAAGCLEQEGDTYNWHSFFSRIYEDWLDSLRNVPRPAPVSTKAIRGNGEERIRTLSRLYRLFEAEFGRSLKYSENEKLRKWLDEDSFSEELLVEALHRGVLQGKPNMSYIGSILSSWRQQGLTTLEAIRQQDIKPGSRHKDKPNSVSRHQGISKNDKYTKLEREILNS